MGYNKGMRAVGVFWLSLLFAGVFGQVVVRSVQLQG